MEDETRNEKKQREKNSEQKLNESTKCQLLVLVYGVTTGIYNTDEKARFSIC